MKTDDYIFAQGNKRERTAINRLIADRSSSLSTPLQEQLGLSLPWCWLGLRIPQRALLEGLELKEKQFLGDIDILGGNLQANSEEQFLEYVENYKNDKAHPSWAYKFAAEKILWEGKTKWTPSFDHIVAIECKASYFSSDETLKATGIGGQHGQRLQAKQLCELGFNKVALLRIITTEPIESKIIHPWTEAGKRSHTALDELEKKLK